MRDYEKLGAFYLGRIWDPEAGQARDEPLLYDARDLTTNAVCVGMTGSGKTGLCIALLEEAAIDGIPALAIDPKGDLGNLLLGFPELRPEDFRPWIDPAEAARQGRTPDEQAQGDVPRPAQMPEALAVLAVDQEPHGRVPCPSNSNPSRIPTPPGAATAQPRCAEYTQLALAGNRKPWQETEKMLLPQLPCGGTPPATRAAGCATPRDRD